MKKLNTKDRIVDAALRLFNEEGTKAVTTNHVAAAAGISPGNLYYHFRNKEEIIREIFSRLAEFTNSESVYGSGFRVEPSITNLEEVFKRVLTLHWEYRFLYREFNALLNRDGELKGIIIKHQKDRLREVRDSIRQFVNAGIFKKMDDAEIEFVMTALWIIGTYWHSFLEANGRKITKARVEDGIGMLRGFLRPYII